MLKSSQTMSKMVWANKDGIFLWSAHYGTVELELKFQNKKMVKIKDIQVLKLLNWNTKVMLLIKEFLNSSLDRWARRP